MCTERPGNMYVLSLLLLAACLPPVWLFEQKPLDDYVAQVDPHYNYTIQKKQHKPGVTIYTLNMTSQKWLDDAHVPRRHVLYSMVGERPLQRPLQETQVDRPIWWHQLFIVVAKKPKRNNSCLLFLLGRNGLQAFPGVDYNLSDAITIARSTGSCVALLKQIPNQPITFHKIAMQQCKNSTEDDLLACSWWMLFNNKTAELHTLALFPMVKTAVRGMDTIIDFLQKTSGGKINITQFTMAGLSKRGWTAWLAAAVDERVRGLFPNVFDLLNFIPNLKHQYRSYCGWSFTLESLYNLNLTRQLDAPRFKELASLIDPLEFNERYANKSIYITVAAGDEFMMPDDSYLYFKELKGEKYFRIIANIGHFFYLAPVPKLPTLIAFFVSVMDNRPGPRVSWTRTETNTTGTIVLRTDQKPSSVKCYRAHTWIWGRRDFRVLVYYFLPLNPVRWFSCRVKTEGKGVYKAVMKKPSKGWRGFFIEATFSKPGSKNYFVLTSEIQILPNTYPCPECEGEQCYGKLV